MSVKQRILCCASVYIPN